MAGDKLGGGEGAQARDPTGELSRDLLSSMVANMERMFTLFSKVLIMQ